MSEVDTGTTRWARKQNDWDCFGFFSKKKKKSENFFCPLLDRKKRRKLSITLSISRPGTCTTATEELVRSLKNGGIGGEKPKTAQMKCTLFIY